MHELAPPERVRSDFDRIARLAADRSPHNEGYQDRLLRELPDRLDSALDLGCGTGSLTRRLASRAGRVLGIDLSPEMIARARAASAGVANASFEQRDFLDGDVPRERFDCIASVAALHHLPIDAALARMRDALAPGGTLVVLDVVRDANALDFARSAAAVPLNVALRLRSGRPLRDPPEVRAAWDAHAATDRYLSLREVRVACAAAGLAGARVRRLLLWRYLLVWRKPR
jgi:SAM-dependent methyltransferase